MLSFYTLRHLKAICFEALSLLFCCQIAFTQVTFRISKPIIGTNQICSNSNNYMSYGFSTNVVDASGYTLPHYIELSNENNLITPRNITYSYPSVNQIYTGLFGISSLNLPSGNGYKIRIYTSSPAIYSEYSETFSVLPSPTTPVLNVSGSISLCPNTSQALSVTNPDNGVVYQWQNYSSNISNATNTNYTATTDGSYSIKAINANGCSVSSNSVYVSRVSSLSSYLNVYLTNSYYGGNPLFALPNQAITLKATFNGGKPPYSFRLNDGSTTTTETNINYSKEYSLFSPTTGSKTYTLSNVTDACGTQLSSSTIARVRINESNYCSVSGQGTMFINSFSIQGTSVNNINSGKSNDGWGEFLTPANINANVNYNFTITSNNSTQKYFAIWADLNQNNIFDSNERVFPTSSSYGQTMTSNFTGVLKLPTSTYNGNVRLRVLLGDDSWYIGNYACSGLSNGEIEDYVLKVFNGNLPTTIKTDSLPTLGVCKNSTFNLGFTITGTSLPANTLYRVEASDNTNFSNSYIIGSGQTSPILCNTNNLNTPYNYYVRVVPSSINSQVVYVKAPNLLNVKSLPTAYLTPFFFENNWPNPNWGCCYGTGPSAGLSVAENSGPFAVYAGISSSNTNFPITVTMSDGRAFTVGSTSIGGNIIRIDSNIIANGVKNYKISRVSNSICTNNKPDSVLIRGGNPYLKIMKVFKGSTNSDTTSISKLCSYFKVKFAGDFLDSLNYKFYHVQISDANGSFANPQDIGHVCIYKVFNEQQGGQDISCSIPTGLSPGNGYKLRIVKKTGNVISPVYVTTFEVLASTTTSLTANLGRNLINEGEVTALNVNFINGTTPPYNLSVYNGYNYQYYNTTGTNTSIMINLSPTDGTRYELYSYNGNICGNSERLVKYLDVRTLDKDNSQWYIKPITYSNTYYYSYDYLKRLAIAKSSDTLFKKTFFNFGTNRLPNNYYDYNSANLLTTKTILQIGESYTLFQVDNFSNTNFNNNLTGVWIDANQDGDFDDAGEELNKNQFDSPWNLTQSQTFMIPSNTNIGFSRIRVRTVSKGNNAEPFDLYASNVLEKNGVTYDIPIAILSNSVTGIISTPKIFGNTLCNGNSFYIDYAKYGIPDGTNAEVQLSDMNGNFSSTPTVIGQGTTSSINVTLPMELTAGNYKLRVVNNGIISPASSSFNVTANQLISMVDGDWHAGSTWSCGRVPTFVDATTVAQGTTVTVFSGDARVGSIITNGVLSFLNGTTLRFRTP